MWAAEVHGSEQLHVREALSAACAGANRSSFEAAAFTAVTAAAATATAATAQSATSATTLEIMKDGLPTPALVNDGGGGQTRYHILKRIRYVSELCAA